MTSMVYKIEKYRLRLFFIFVLCAGLGYFFGNDFKTVRVLVPEALVAPVQTPIKNPVPVKFEKDGFSYSVTPIYDYDISGLVVSRFDYNRWWSMSRTDEVFTTDLCLFWGENISSGAYQNKTLSVKQDFRFCLYSYQTGPHINEGEVSNNHLMVNDPGLKKIISGIKKGDVVRIRGKLANVKATTVSEIKKIAEGRQMEWTTSTKRDDAGAGACEIIYVESVEIVQNGHPVWNMFYFAGTKGMLAVVAWFFLSLVIWVFINPRFYKK